MLEVVNLTKTYGHRTALHKVSFSAHPGEILGVLGPNGAGKSTLLTLLAGIAEPTDGEIRWQGQRLPAQRRAGVVGYVPQEIALHAALTVRDNLQLWGRLAKLDRRQLARRMAEIAELVGLTDRLDHRVVSLSGGMKRKVNMAVSLLAAPALLIMDEPTVGIDIGSTREILRFIRAQADAGRTVIYTTHHTSEVARLCDRVLLMNEGQVRFLGTLRQAAETADAANISGPLDEVFAALGGW